MFSIDPKSVQVLESRDFRLPTVEEILRGETQGGVARPSASTDALFNNRASASAMPPSVWGRVLKLFGIVR